METRDIQDKKDVLSTKWICHTIFNSSGKLFAIPYSTSEWMFEATGGMDQHEFALIFKQYFVVQLYSLLEHVLIELVTNEPRTGNKDTFDHIKVHVTEDSLHDTLKISL